MTSQCGPLTKSFVRYLQNEELVKKSREDKDKIETQQNQIEEMERRIKILEGDLEAAEDSCEENKK